MIATGIIDPDDDENRRRELQRRVKKELEKLKKPKSMRDKVMYPVRLLTEEDGKRVWRTFQGHAVIGCVDSHGVASLGLPAEDRKTWGNDYWFVFLAANGSIVIYRKPILVDGPGTIRIVEGQEALRAALPPELADDVAVEMGWQKDPSTTYPEEPLFGEETP